MGTLTPNIKNDDVSPKNVSESVLKLPPLLQSDALHINKSQISMKTIFVPGVPINSVKFNDNGQRLAYSTEAGVIQVYQFPASDFECSEEEKISPKLLHTFCVSKPNKIVSICWDSQNDNRLFIAIGNFKKKGDHIISFGDVRIEYMECSQNAKNRLIVSGSNESSESVLYLYDECGDGDTGNEWKLISQSNKIKTVIRCIEHNHNGKIIMIGGKDGNIRIFDVKNGYFTELTTWIAHKGGIQSIHLCDDANSIISIAEDFVVKHWQINNDNNECKKVWKLQQQSNDILPLLCLGPNNFFAVTQSKAVRDENKENELLYNVMIKNIENESDSEIVIGGHSKIITAIDWHKESQMIATCSFDGTLRIFQVFS